MESNYFHCGCESCVSVYAKPDQKTKIHRPDWDHYFLNLAGWVAARSCDGETQVGAVITDANHHILGTGYNSFPPGMPDDLISNLRPHKYLAISHAEIAALANCSVSLQQLRGGATIYLTMPPCLDCFKALLHNNIQRIVAYDIQLSAKFMENRDVFTMLLHNSKVRYDLVEHPIF